MDRVQLRDQLLAERANAVARLTDLDASFVDIVDAAKDSNLDDEHDPEGATIAAERSMISSLAEAARRSVTEIDAALTRIADGTYGSCARCGRPIADGRLEARPSATLCIECA